MQERISCSHTPPKVRHDNHPPAALFIESLTPFIKGQSYNLPLLARFLGNSLSPRLIDYEQLTSDKDGKRTVAFGFFAGSAGVVEGLHASALDLLQIGIASPFLVSTPCDIPARKSSRENLGAPSFP